MPMGLREDADQIIKDSISNVLPDEAVRRALADRAFFSSDVIWIVLSVVFFLLSSDIIVSVKIVLKCFLRNPHMTKLRRAYLRSYYTTTY